jgi:hypothetical protein
MGPDRAGARGRRLAVYVRGGTGKLAGARIYDDTYPPLGSEQ